MSLADNIKFRRKEKGLSQCELAQKIGISQPTLAQYEKGVRSPSMVTGVELDRALGTTAEKLVEE